MINGHLPKAKVKSSFGFYRGTSVYVYQSPAPTQPRLVLDSFLGPSFSHCLTHQPGRRLNQLCVTFNAWRRTLKCQTWTVASHRRHKSTHTHTHTLQLAVSSDFRIRHVSHVFPQLLLPFPRFPLDPLFLCPYAF